MCCLGPVMQLAVPASFMGLSDGRKNDKNITSAETAIIQYVHSNRLCPLPLGFIALAPGDVNWRLWDTFCPKQYVQGTPISAWFLPHVAKTLVSDAVTLCI